MSEPEPSNDGGVYARDVIIDRLVAELGHWTSLTTKVFRWEILPKALHVVLLEAKCGTVIIPWDEGRDHKPYFGTVSYAAFGGGQAVEKRRSTNIASYAPSLGWDKDILYLSPMMFWELDRTIEFIHRKKLGVPIAPLSEPDADSPILGFGARGVGWHGRGPIPWSTVRAVFERDQARCVWCGTTERLHIDHLIPRAKGGGNDVANLQVLCERCNLAKSDRI